MEQLINFIIRPPRAEYNPKNDLLDEEFVLKGKWYQRKDMEVVNSRGDIIQCSHYMPMVLPEGNALPCVIYCHGNSGCRADASEAAIILLPSNITVFALDFSGSGLSGGEHVTLGWNEKDDLRAVVDYLRADGKVSLIGLWGRSMGSVTSLMYGAEDPSIAGMVLDSPFSDLVDLMMELVDTYKVRLPKFTVKFAIQYMRRAIQKKARFDISDLNTIKVAKSCFVPVLFGHAIDDDFIQPHHSDRIFDAYVGDKNIIKFEGDHNSLRPQFYFDSISIFFKNVLQPPEDELGGTYFDLNHDHVGKRGWSSTSHELFGSPAASSSENAIKQLRSRRPMSSIVVPADISSTNEQPDPQVESRGSDSHPSSSNMISYEMTDGNPHVPTSIDDDEYVEYSVDTLADFPSNAEEEERMFMLALLESLKDLPMKNPPTEEPTTPDNKLVSQMPASDPNKLSLDSPPKHTSSSEAETQETQETCSPSDTSTCYHSLSDIDIINHSNETSTLSKNTSHCHNDTLSENPSSSEVDMADRTTVTVNVEKNPTNNIVDGLLRRWDLNFFRNR